MRRGARIALAALAAAALASAGQAAALRVAVSGAGLEYQVQGSGEPVLLIHGNLLADAFAPLLAEPVWKGYRLITYHRQGYAGSTHAPGTLSIERQAADAHAVLDALGVGKAHVVGYGYGGLIALQLALDVPERIQTLSLLEAAMRSAMDEPSADSLRHQVLVAYQAGRRREVVEIFLRIDNGGDTLAAIEKTLPPGALDLAARDLDTFIQDEVPSRATWSFAESEGARLRMPVLCLAGERTIPTYFRSHRDLLKWIPGARGAVIAGAPHAMLSVNPAAVAQALHEFFAENPIGSQ